MSNRALIVLTVLLVALAIMTSIGNHDNAPDPLTGARFLPELETAADDVSGITVLRAGGERVATIERDDGRWTVRERGGYVADVGLVRDTLIALTDARVVEPKTASARFYPRLGVEPVELETAGGTAISLEGTADPITVILGDSVAGGQRFARRADEQQSYQIDRDPTLPRETTRWLDPVIVDLPPDRVARVTIRHADGEIVTLSKSQPDQPNFTVNAIPEGRDLLYAGVGNTVGGALRNLRLEDVEPADEAFEPDVEIEFVSFDGLLVRARGARRNEQPWIEFSAGLDESDQSEATDSTVTEAAQINSRVSGWRYRIAPFQFDQMTRRMTDLLQGSP